MVLVRSLKTQLTYKFNLSIHIQTMIDGPFESYVKEPLSGHIQGVLKNGSLV